MRTFSLGSDRYTRSYWFLPNSGGIFVEGVDTSTLSVKKGQKLSVIEEESAGIINPVGSKRKLSVKVEHCDDDDDVFEKPVKRIKESQTGAPAPTSLPVLSDTSYQTNSHNEVTLNHTHSPTSSPSPCNEPHPSSSTDCTSQLKSAHTESPQPMRSCVITGHGSQSPEETRDRSVDRVPEDNLSTQCSTPTEDVQQNAQNSMYVNAQPTVAYLSNGQLVYSTMPQNSLQYVVPHQGGGYMFQDPQIQTGQLIQGPDGVQYLAVHPQNNMMTQAYIQMENGEQQLCMVANGGIGTVDDGNIYTMTVPSMEALNNEIESLPYRNDILLLMLEMPVLRQPAKEEKDTGPSLGELLAHIDPSKCSDQ